MKPRILRALSFSAVILTCVGWGARVVAGIGGGPTVNGSAGVHDVRRTGEDSMTAVPEQAVPAVPEQAVPAVPEHAGTAGPEDGTAPVIPPAAEQGAPVLSWRALRSSFRQAERARKEGRDPEALRVYESILAGTKREHAKRSEALYWTGMLRLSPDPRLRDLNRARGALEELKRSFPSWDRRSEVVLAIALIQETASIRSAYESRLIEIAGLVESCRAENHGLSGRATAAEEDAKVLKTEIETLRAEAQTMREDLRRKEEALRKVKEVVVGWKPSR